MNILPVAFNLTEVPQSVATTLGISVDMAGILLSVFITMCVLLALAYLNASTMLISVGGIGMIVLFTIITWFPAWIAIIISLIGAGILAGTLSGRRTPSGET